MSTEHLTSTGHDLSDTTWLDQHFNFAREPYEAMVRWVGYQPGSHILDAGCGSGAYLPWLAELAGPTGRLSALDLSPENIAAVEARLKAMPLACPVDVRLGSVLTLPYSDGEFDAIWNASVSQYLTDDELRQMFAEFRRVVRPGGLVAIKDFHWGGTYSSVVPLLTAYRLYDALCQSGNIEWIGMMRTPDLPRWLRTAGLTEVRQKFFAVEKRSPLNTNDRAFWLSVYAYESALALGLSLPPDDLAFWHEVSDAGRVAEQLDSPDFYTRSEYTLAVGRVP